MQGVPTIIILNIFSNPLHNIFKIIIFATHWRKKNVLKDHDYESIIYFHTIQIVYGSIGFAH